MTLLRQTPIPRADIHEPYRFQFDLQASVVKGNVVEVFLVGLSAMEESHETFQGRTFPILVTDGSKIRDGESERATGSKQFKPSPQHLTDLCALKVFENVASVNELGRAVRKLRQVRNIPLDDVQTISRTRIDVDESRNNFVPTAQMTFL